MLHHTALQTCLQFSHSNNKIITSHYTATTTTQNTIVYKKQKEELEITLINTYTKKRGQHHVYVEQIKSPAPNPFCLGLNNVCRNFSLTLKENLIWICTFESTSFPLNLI